MYDAYSKNLHDCNWLIHTNLTICDDVVFRLSFRLIAKHLRQSGIEPLITAFRIMQLVSLKHSIGDTNFKLLIDTPHCSKANY